MSSKRVVVANLSRGIDEKRLAEYFGEVGRVVSAHILTDEIGRGRGLAIVEFFTEEEAGFALQVYDGRRFAGLKLSVRPADGWRISGGRARNLDRNQIGGGRRRPARHDRL